MSALENPDLPHERLRAALERAVAAWLAPTAACGHLNLSIDGGTSGVADVRHDDINLVLWRLPGFCQDPQSAQAAVCSAVAAAAVTTVFFYDRPGSDRDGEMIEADLELNAAAFPFSDDGAPDKIDLQNTLTHELGHVLGLDHTCYTFSQTRAPVDAVGHPVPRCFPLANLAPDVTAATMFAFEALGEISKRVPRADEWQGLCAIYRGHSDVCESALAGCQVVPARARPGDGGLAVVLLSGAALVLTVRRRLRRRAR